MSPSAEPTQTPLPLLADDLPTDIPDRRWWRIVQRVIAAVTLLVMAPFLLLLCAAIALESRGPILFRQQRRGIHERPFTILKFRTMRTGTERATALGTTSTSSAVTRTGRFLRATKLDELPQLWNVLTGDMELVGPRPLPIALDDELRRHIPSFAARYRVRPGLTNIAQVCVYENQLGDKLVDDWSTRFDAELQYIRRKSVRLDCLLILMTIAFIARKALTRGTGPAPVNAVRSVSILGVPIACLSYDGVISQITSWVNTRTPHYIGICPVHSIIEALLHADHRAVLRGSGLNTADGMPVVWARWLLGDRTASRVYGPTLMLKLLEHAQAQNWRVAFYGGKPQCLQQLTYRMQWAYPALNIAAAISPPMGIAPADEQLLIDQLAASQPHLIFVGLGCPKQERWMARHSPHLNSILLGVGAAFDFHAGTVPQSPAWMQKVGLEWLFRLRCEPRRLFRRYATTNPLYILAFSGQWLTHLLLRRRYIHWHSPTQEVTP